MSKEAMTLALDALNVAEHFVEEYAALKYYFAHIEAKAVLEEALAKQEVLITSNSTELENQKQAAPIAHHLEPSTRAGLQSIDVDLPTTQKQEQGEPVAWMDEIKKESHKRFKLPTSQAAFQAGALLARQYIYTTPPQRKPLTGEQAAKILEAEHCWLSNETLLRIIRAIEAAHGIKE